MSLACPTCGEPRALRYAKRHNAPIVRCYTCQPERAKACATAAGVIAAVTAALLGQPQLQQP